MSPRQNEGGDQLKEDFLLLTAASAAHGTLSALMVFIAVVVETEFNKRGGSRALSNVAAPRVSMMHGYKPLRPGAAHGRRWGGRRVLGLAQFNPRVGLALA